MHLSLHDSAGKILFTVQGGLFQQTLQTPFVGQQLFSNDNRHLLVREFLGRIADKDSFRLRVYTTADFHKEADIRYTESPDNDALAKKNAVFSPDSKSFYYTALQEDALGSATILYQYTLEDGSASLLQQMQLCADNNCHLPLSVRKLSLSPDGTQLTYIGMVNYNPPNTAPN